MPIVWPLLSGLLLWGSFWAPWLALVALVPLMLLVLREDSARRIYLGAWLGGLAFFLPGVQWLRYCDKDAWLGWLLLALYLSLYFPVFVLSARLLCRWLPLRLAAPAAWVGLEYVRMYLLSGFGWLLLAHSVWQWSWLIQIADVAGVYGVSFLLAFVNAVLAEIVQDSRTADRGAPRGKIALAARLAPAAIALAGSVLYGWFRVQQEPFATGPTVALVQTNLEQSIKNQDNEKSLKHVAGLTTLESAQKADLIIWPETSYPRLFGRVEPTLSTSALLQLWTERFKPRPGESPPTDDYGALIRSEMERNANDLAAFTDWLGKPLLVGMIWSELRPDYFRQYNSSVLLAPHRGVIDHYDKIHLVPFGEFVPLRETLPLLKILLPYDTDTFGIDAATDYRTLQLGRWHFASLICFEDTLPHLARMFLRQAATGPRPDFFVNQSNDGWFQGSVEADYHLAASVFRSVENRRPMVRSANMAVTALIDGNGVVRARLPRCETGCLIATVPIDGRQAPYLYLGDWLPLGCLIAGIVAVAAGLLRFFWAGRLTPPAGKPRSIA